jgi:predicted transcriptional regulator
MTEAISQREAARRAGLSESTIRHHISTGALASAVLPNGKLDAEKVEKLLPRIVQKGTVAPAALAVAKTRRLRAQVSALGHEVEDLQRQYIPAVDAERAVLQMMDGIAGRIRRLPDTAKTLTGLPAKLVHTMLRDRIHAALTAISSAAFAERENEPWWDKPIKREVDLSSMSENDLLARRITLQATKMEIDNMRERGVVRPVTESVREAGERLATAKSLLLAIPSRVAEQVAAASPAVARKMVAEEVGHVLAELGVAS